MPDTQPLGGLEAILAQHQAFGASDYIQDQLSLSYQRQLDWLSDCLPIAGELLGAVRNVDRYSQHRLLGDPAVRCAIQHAVTQLRTDRSYGMPLDECEGVFAAAYRHVEDGRRGGPLQSGAPDAVILGPEPDDSWVWTEEHSEDVFGRAFRSVVEQNFGAPLCTPSDDEIDMLQRGARLLHELVPHLSRSALSHVHVVALFPPVGNWKGKGSCSQFRIGGTFFLSRERLQNPWWVAEHLLHEALHHKLYDFRRGHSLFDGECERGAGPRVCSPWNVHDAKGSNYWDAFRTFAACHVYVHLTLLCTLAERRAVELEPVYGPLRRGPAMTESRKAGERAHYLVAQLRLSCWDELGLAGKTFTEWMESVMDALDPCPPPNGAYLHLLLDLYKREARRAASILGKTAPNGAELRRQLMGLIKVEVASTCHVLSVLDAEAQLSEFKAALAGFPEEIPGDDFPRVRRLIARALLDASPDGYSLKRSACEPATNDETVKQMVQDSSQRLHTMLAA